MIVTLGQTLGKAIVAEGIETNLHLRYVQNLGCHYAQGFLFSSAVESSIVETWLEAEARQSRGVWAEQMQPNQSYSC
jgi:EAL domain-containing protein (putative c-di-GMP-specific phosphodiesterase class I)